MRARAMAIKAGDKTYVSEKPCKRGHLTERLTSTGICLECRKLQSRERYAKNPEFKVKQAQEYYFKNAEARRLARRKKYALDPEKELSVSRIRVAEWRKNNPEKVAAHKSQKKAYKQANPHKAAYLLAKRRAAKKQRTPKWLTSEDHWVMEQFYELASLRSKMLGFQWHVDHMVPLQGSIVSGLHVPWNLRVVPWMENVSKGNKFDVEISSHQ